MFNKIKEIFRKKDYDEPQVGENSHKTKIIVAVFLLLVIGSVFFSLNSRQAVDSGSIKFSLEALKSDMNGIEKSAKFVLRSDRQLSDGAIKKYLQFSPAVDFSVQGNKLNIFSRVKNLLLGRSALAMNNEYEIIPKSELNEGVIYKIATATSTEAVFDHDYSWAFQVKEEFDIKDSFPSDTANGVPVNTGVEIIFNRLNIEKSADKYFEIQPEVKGRFETGIDKLTFIPEKDLSEKTLYKVTIKKGYQSGERGEALAEDKSFSFETVSINSASESYLYWNSNYSEMTPDKEGLLEASGSATSSEAAVYKYPRANDFLNDYYKYQNRSNSWSAYNQEQFSPNAQAKEIFKFKPELLKQDENNNYGLIKMPRKLEAGSYVLKLTSSDYSEYTFVRVSSLAYYYSEINGDGLIWAYDFPNKKPFANIKIYSLDRAGAEKEFGTTDENGLVGFNSSSDKDEDGNNASLIFRGDNLGETAVPDIDRMFRKKINYYQGYLNSDRYAYRLTDKIHFWGVVRGRSFDLREKKVKVSLDGLVEREVVVSPFDTIEGELDFSGMGSGYHNIVVSYNDETIVQSGVEIFSFEKPLYKIEILPDKGISVTGEPVKAKIKVNFFDGTPVAGMDLSYSISWRNTQDGFIKTNDNGEAELAYTPEYYFEEGGDQYSDFWTTYPIMLRFSVRPTLSEEGEIWGDAYVSVYGPKINIQSEEFEKDDLIVFKSKINELNLATSTDGDIIGRAVAGAPVKVKIIKYYYEQIPDGEIYNAIEKIKIKKYRYETRKVVIREAEGLTDNIGEWSFAVPKGEAPNSGYLKAIFSSEDNNGKKVKSSIESYNYYHDNDNTALNLSDLRSERGEYVSYKIGDKVRLKPSLTGSQKSLDDRVLIIRFQEGLRGQEVVSQDVYTDNFADNHLPSMSYMAVKIMPYGFLESNSVTTSFNEEEKRLDVEIKTDKEKYRPREDINLNINIKDKDKKVVKAVANVAAVDEALFNVTPWGYGSDILAALYSDIYAWPNSLSSSYTTNFKNGAEKGGCFAAGTVIRMSAGWQKNIEDIRVGDEIETFTTDNSAIKARSVVQGVSSHEASGYLLINNKLKVTPEHKIYLSGQWKVAGEARVGDYLTNEQRESEAIKEIKYVKAKNIRVYNIIVGQYHTYFAGGYYVHNAEKGGGGDSRNFFQDTPLYKQFETDDNGEIKTALKAPDNLTSWRIAVNAYSPNGLMAGSADKLVPVSLPLFADAVIAKQYLVGDKPEIKIRAFGSEYKKDKAVDYSVFSDSLKIDFKISALTDTINVPLGKLPIGKHKITVVIKQGDLKDALEKNFEVLENYVRKYKSDSQSISNGLSGLKGSAGGFTDILFADDGKGKYYDRLLDLNWTSSARSDIQSAAYLAAKTLNNYFYNGQEHFSANINLSGYQNYHNDFNVISLFPYGPADFSLTAKLADAMPEKFDNSAILSSLETKLDNKKSGIEETSILLYGLSALGQPELPFINYLKTNSNTTMEAKIYLALALYKAGDGEGARAIYFNELLPQLKTDSDMAYLEIGADRTKNIKVTAVLGILMSYLEKEADNENLKKIMMFLKNNQPADDSTSLEQAMILQNEIAKVNLIDASFSYQTDSRKGVIDLSNGQTSSLTIGEKELNSLTFSNVKGKSLAISYFEEYANPSDLAKNNQVGVKRSYLINDKEAVDFKEGDLVLVRLDPMFFQNSPDDNYQLVDYLPSNLKPVIREYNLNMESDNSCNPIWYPFKLTDEAIYFNVGKWFKKSTGCQNRTVNYHARVVGKGEFRAQGAIIQSLNNLDITNISEEKIIKVK